MGAAAPEAAGGRLSVAPAACTDRWISADDFGLRVAHRDILGGLVRALAADPDAVDTPAAIRAVDKRAKVDEGEYLGLLSDAGLSRSTAREFDELIAGVETVDDLDAVAAAGGDDVADAVANLRNVLAAAADFGAGDYCTVSLTTARGLDYYTGVVFECFDSTGTVSRAVVGVGCPPKLSLRSS